MAFIDECRRAGQAVESICEVLTGQGCQVAARTYRARSSPDQHVAPRTVYHAQVMDVVRDDAWTVDEDGPLAGVSCLTAEGLYGRRRMTARIKRAFPAASPGSVDRAMRVVRPLFPVQGW